MSQQNALRALDAEILTGITSAGFSDSATYTPAKGFPTYACTILVDQDVQLDGVEAQGASRPIIITAFLAEIPSAPTSGATFLVGATTYTVDQLVSHDESRVVVLCR